MNAKTYSPRDDSVAARVIEFLSANPDESLTAADVAVKFDCGRNNVHSLLGMAVGAGHLVREEDAESGDLVYRLDTRAGPAAGSRPQALPGSAANPFGTASRAARLSLSIDVAQIAVDRGVPLPPRVAPGTDWGRLFRRMAPGDSFALPAKARGTVAKAITAHQTATGQRFAVRTVDGGIRVWRVS